MPNEKVKPVESSEAINKEQLNVNEDEKDEFNNDVKVEKEVTFEDEEQDYECEEKETEDSASDSGSDSPSTDSSEEERRRKRKAKKKARKARLKQEKREQILSEEEPAPEVRKRKDKRKKDKRYEPEKKVKKFVIQRSPEEIAREEALREQVKAQRLAEEEKAKKHYKYGRYFLLVLALASIPFDLYKLIDAIIKSENYITTSLHDSINFYGGTLCTHIIGFLGAIEHQLWLTIFCRFICTFVYQFEMTSKSNDSVPTDPDQLKKYADKKLFQKRGNPNKQIDPDDDLALILFNITKEAFVTL